MSLSVNEGGIYAFLFTNKEYCSVQKLAVSIEPEMVIIPEGEFLIVCETGAAGERPVHRVWVDRFAFARTAITNRLYQFFLEDTEQQASVSLGDKRFNHPDQ